MVSAAIGGRPGYCPQTVVLDEALTVDQHVRYFQAAYGVSGAGRAEELIERLGYGRCRGQRAGTPSGGTRQKLSLTLALMHDPPVLLLDEPYQGLDWQTYLAFWDWPRDLRDAGNGDGGHQPSGLRARTFRPDLPPRRMAGSTRRRAAMRQQLDIAVRLSLAGQIRNRLARILLVTFVPVWYS